MSFNVDYIINLRDKATAKLSALDAKANRTNKSFSGLGATLGRVFAIGAIVMGAKKIATLGIEMEQTRVAFATFLGDAGKANALIAELNEFANVTPFDNAQIITASRALLTAGVSAEGMTAQLKTIGDVAAGAGVPITELSQIFAKATNKGKLQAEELNQFAERGIPILDVLAKKWGMNKAQVLKMGEQGKITADVMKEAFETMSGEGGKFFNMMDKQSKTTGGKISTLIGKMQMIGIKIGEALLPAISFLTDIAIKLSDNTKLLKTIAMIVGVVAAAFIAFKVATLLSSLSIGGMTAAFWKLNAVMLANPIGLILIGIAALVAAFIIAWNHSETFRGVLFGLWEVIKLVGGAIWEFLVAPFKEVWGILKPMIPAIKQFFSDMIEFIKPVGKALFDFLVAPIKLAIDGIKSALRFLGILGGEESVIGNIKDTFKKGFQEGVDDFNKDGTKKEGGIASMLGVAGGDSALLGASGAAGSGKGLNSGISGVTSSAPKTFNINIESLVEQFTISTTNMAESVEKTKEMITQALIVAVNDVSIIDK